MLAHANINQCVIAFAPDPCMRNTMRPPMLKASLHSSTTHLADHQEGTHSQEAQQSDQVPVFTYVQVKGSGSKALGGRWHGWGVLSAVDPLLGPACCGYQEHVPMAGK